MSSNSFVEDFDVMLGDLAFIFMDPEGDTMTFSQLSPVPSLVTNTDLDPVTGLVTFNPIANAHGVEVFVWEARDTNGETATFTFTLTVVPVNDAPSVVGPVPVLVTLEGTPVSLDLSGTFDDVDIVTDGDSLTLTVEGITGSVIDSAEMSGASLDLTFLSDQNGAATVTVRATDSEDLFVETTINVTVSAVNDVPTVVGAAADMTVDEDDGASTSFAGVFDDVDIATNGDVLTLTVTSFTGSVIDTATMAGATLNVTLLPDQNGDATVIVRATDSGGLFVESTVDLTVDEVNDVPFVASPIADVTTFEDAPDLALDLSSVFGDVDIATNGDSLTLSVESFTGAVIETASMSGFDLYIALLPDQNGAATVTVRATDSENLFVETTVDVTVTPVNDPPTVVAAASDITVDEDTGSSTSLAGVFTDVDIATNGDVLTLTVTSFTGSVIGTATMAGSTLNVTLLPDQNGSATVTVLATDSEGLFVDTTVNVMVDSVNDAPVVISPFADVETFEDGPDLALDFAGVFGDVDIATDGDMLTLSVGANTNAALFDVQSFSGTTLTLSLALDMFGTADIRVDARDTAGAAVSDTFTITVTSVNDLPLAVDDVAFMNEDDPFLTIPVLVNDYLAEEPTTITAAGVGGFSESTPTTVIDPFGDPISGPNAVIRISGSSIEYEPKPDYFGVDYFTYTITDSDGDTSTATVMVNVLAVNDPPLGIQERTFNMLENGVLTVPASQGVFTGAYDVDGKLLDPLGNEVGSPLSATLILLPIAGTLNFDSVTGEFVYTPPINFTGEVEFAYRLFDGQNLSLTPDYMVRITINAAPPPAAPPNPGQVSVTFNLSNTPLEQSA
ncbi:MAG: tandem-95 repeat protein, partial [Gammaproteobacteria bacterium]|nr:tandem-95 repeat protein [Gammaproteobacteria bacterium]